ncbi:MAG TPA: GAF domain-containing protein [Lacisediminihabitans sp.]|uniref:GAF domain-containing protein n=1 Tax=Lacisediminihabitans sp. TaxID=2787631 RepID=UPI002EDB966C
MAMVLAAVTIQIVQAYRDDHLAKDLEDERSQLNRRIRDAVKPIPELIAQLPALSYPDRALRVQGIAQACATALYMLIAPHAENIRTAVFALEENPDRMTWLAHVGRGRTPCPFTPGTVRGDAAFEFITALQPAFYPDLTTQQPAGYDESPSDYRTFISIPLWTDESVYGMVTVDAPDPGALTVGDQYVAELIAELMAAAFEIANNGSLSTPLP